MQSLKRLPNQNLIGLLVAAALLFLGASLYVAHQTATVTALLDERIAGAEASLRSLALAAEGSVPSKQRVVADCAPQARERFDLLLGQLAVLPEPELSELNELFATCGVYPALEKAVIVSQLERELGALKDYITLRTVSDGRSVIAYPLETWDELVSLERDRSVLFTRLTNIQRELLVGRVQGARSNDPSTRALLDEAQLVRDGIVAVSARAGELRTALEADVD